MRTVLLPASARALRLSESKSARVTLLFPLAEGAGEGALEGALDDALDGALDSALDPRGNTAT